MVRRVGFAKSLFLFKSWGAHSTIQHTLGNSWDKSTITWSYTDSPDDCPALRLAFRRIHFRYPARLVFASYSSWIKLAFRWTPTRAEWNGNAVWVLRSLRAPSELRKELNLCENVRFTVEDKFQKYIPTSFMMKIIGHGRSLGVPCP